MPAVAAAAARELDLPRIGGWVLTLGQGDELSRNVFHLFPAGSVEPAWVLKFARVGGYPEPFDRDERGLGLAAGAGGDVAAHAPRLLGRLDAEGVHASVESAAVGPRLRELLTAPWPAERMFALVDRIAAWTLELGAETAEPPEALEAERRRLLADVVPRWAAHGIDRSIVEALPPVPAVLQHNDLGSWNVLVDGSAGFTAVDWESAHAAALPLWDLLYFLADALALLDGSTSGAERHRHTAALFRGDLDSSRTLFRWVRAAVERLALPPESVGSIATLCWLHHALSPVERRRALDLHAPDAAPPVHGTELIAETWLRTPGLGVGWAGWR